MGATGGPVTGRRDGGVGYRMNVSLGGATEEPREGYGLYSRQSGEGPPTSMGQRTGSDSTSQSWRRHTI